MNQEQTEAEARAEALKKTWECVLLRCFSWTRTFIVIVVIRSNRHSLPLFCLFVSEAFLVMRLLIIMKMIKTHDVGDHGWWKASMFSAFVGFSLTAVSVFFGLHVHSAGSIFLVVILFMPLPFDIMLLRHSPWYRERKEINPGCITV